MSTPRKLGRRTSAVALAGVALLMMISDPATPYGPPGDAGEPAASTLSSLSLWSPSIARDARAGWPMAPSAEHRRDVQRAVVRGVRHVGCRITRVRATPLRGAGIWTVRTNASPGEQRGPWCAGYRVVRVQMWEDGSGVGWPTPPPAPAPYNPRPWKV